MKYACYLLIDNMSDKLIHCIKTAEVYTYKKFIQESTKEREF